MPTPSDPLALHWSRAPPVYVARRLAAPLVIDGNLNKPEWRSASWSVPFDEIRGPTDAPAGSRPPPGCRTRVKMLYDEEYLYVAALLEYDESPIMATFTERNSPIFHQDSDFEVFVDADASCHNYKELELNALNTAWNLLLDRPYADGGAEHSGRVAQPGESLFYDVERQRTATRLVRGSVHSSPEGAGSGTSSAWAVEIALAHSESVSRTRAVAPPTAGSAWRINFSRVERRGLVNWVWAAQRAWDPAARRFCGHVDMHRPDAWGYLVFGAAEEQEGGDGRGEARPAVWSDSGGAAWRDALWPARLAALSCYYAQRHHYEGHGRYARRLSELGLEEEVVSPFKITMDVEEAAGESGGREGTTTGRFLVKVDAGAKLGCVCVGHDRLVSVAIDEEAGCAGLGGSSGESVSET